MLVLMLQHVSSRVAGFFGAVAVSMGKQQNHSSSNVSKQVVTSWKSFYAAGAILLRRFQTMRRIFRGKCNTLKTSEVTLRGRRSTLDVSCCVFSSESQCQRCATWWQGWQGANSLAWGGILSQVMKNDGSINIDFEVGRHFTAQFTLYTPHFTLSTLNCTSHTLHFALQTLRFTLETPHFTLHTLHFTLYTPHDFNLYTPHFALYTVHPTLYTFQFPLHT